jgi:signal transduction histidine kinase
MDYAAGEVMRQQKNHGALSVSLLAALTFVQLAVSGIAENQPPAYLYEDTRRLVALVENAAALVEREGERAFAEFNAKGSKWLIDQYYIFVYALDGTCLFHPIQPELVGKNLMGLRDMDGKPVVQFVTEIGHKPERNASGWIFYLWPDKVQLTPLWKSAYIRKVFGPGNKTYLVGSGVYNIKTERLFVQERVRMAADLLQTKGKDIAFQEFRNRASPFVFLDTYIFVLDKQGHTIVDPAYPTLKGSDLSGFQDAVGVPAVQEMLRKLQRGDEAWVQYLWPRPGASLPSRKLIYARKVTIGTETLIVGSDFFLPTPIWMKG